MSLDVKTKLNRGQIQSRAMDVLEASPHGIRWVDLLNGVAAFAEGTPRNSVQGAIHQLLATRTSEIVKVARGTYQLAVFNKRDNEEPEANTSDITTVYSDKPNMQPLTERDFYSSFAEWLVENDEATNALELGGSSLGGKWGTPDVIGVLKPQASDIFKFEPQIVTAEVKIVPSQPVVAFGQAVAYRLFSHKSYIAIPNTTTSEDMSRLKSLCSIHGVGLVSFDLDKNSPDYNVLVIPATAKPDMFYVNGMLDRIKSSAPDLLNKLF